MNKAIILVLILTNLFQLFSQKKDDNGDSNEKFETIYTPQEDYDAAVKTLKNDETVYTPQEDYDAAAKTLKNGENVYIDNDKDNLWHAYAYIFADNIK